MRSTNLNLQRILAKLQQLRDPSRFINLIGSTFVIQLLGYALTYLLNVAMARWLDNYEYGNYVFTFNFIVLLALFATFGSRMSVMRYVPEFLSVKNFEHLTGVSVFSVVITILGSILLVLLASAGMLIKPPSDIRLDVILIGLWVTPFYALFDLITNISRGFGHVARAFVPNLVARPILTIAFTYVAIFIMSRTGSIYAIIALLLSILVALAYQFYTVITDLNKHVETWSFKIEWRDWFTTSLYMLAFQSAPIIMSRGLVIIIGFMLGSTETTLFSIGERIGNLTNLILTTAGAVFAPMVSPLYRQGNMAELERLLVIIARLSILGALAIGTVLIVGADFLLRVFGDEYLPARSIIIIFVLGYNINAAFGPMATVLNMAGGQQVNARITLITSIIGLVGSIILTPLFGIEGTAIGWLLWVIWMNIWVYYAVKKRMNIHPLPIIMGLRKLPAKGD